MLLKLEGLSKIDSEFKDILRTRDKQYIHKIQFSIVYTHDTKDYKINIFPAKEGFDSQEYFRKNFETEEEQEKLSEFAEKNNIRMITY
jgi:ACT domain-containing protein